MTKFLGSLTAWLTLLCLVLTCWFLFKVLGNDIVSKADTLPKALCTNSTGSTEDFTNEATGGIILYYSTQSGEQGCNRFSDNEARKLSQTAERTRVGLTQIGLPMPGSYEIRAVRLGAALQMGDNNQSLSFNATRRPIGFSLADGLAKMSIVRMAPSIPDRPLQAIAQAFALNYSGSAAQLQNPSFETWVLAKHGSEPFLKAMSGCSQGCNFNSRLDKALDQQGYDAARLHRQYNSKF